MIATSDLKAYLTKCSSERLERICKEIEVLLHERQSKSIKHLSLRSMDDYPYASLRPTGTSLGRVRPKK